MWCGIVYIIDTLTQGERQMCWRHYCLVHGSQRHSLMIPRHPNTYIQTALLLLLLQIWVQVSDVILCMLDFLNLCSARLLRLPKSNKRFVVESRGPIYKISYDNLTIILRRCQSYDRLTTYKIYKTSYEGCKAILGYDSLESCKIVWDSVRKLPYDIPKRNFSTF